MASDDLHSAVGPLQMCSPIREISTCFRHDEHLIVGRKLDSLTPAIVTVSVPCASCRRNLRFPLTYTFRFRIETPGRVRMRPGCGLECLLADGRIGSMKGKQVAFSCQSDEVGR